MQEAAVELTALAAELANGRIRIGDEIVTVNGPVSLKTKKKVKHDETSVEINLWVPLHGNLDRQALTARDDQTDSPRQPPAKSRTQPAPVKESPTNKKLKKEIGRQWKTLVKAVEAGQLPPKEETAQLLGNCEEYTLFAGPEWLADWQRCTEMIKQLASAADQGDLQTSQSLLAEVNGLYRSCHKMYK